jgi:signal transduction histidine kinase
MHMEEFVETGELRCIVDPFQVGQVFWNVLENALQACQDPVLLSVTYAARVLNDQPSLSVSIRDNGTGLSTEARQRIFEPFYTTSTQGTGLGMAIVKRIVEDHHGGVEVGNNGPGTEIIITIPRGRV